MGMLREGDVRNLPWARRRRAEAAVGTKALNFVVDVKIVAYHKADCVPSYG